MALDPDVSDKTHKICTNLYSYGINIKMLNLKGYEDVGEMTKKEFKRRRKIAEPWMPNKRLIHMIKKIRSGSLI